MALTSIELQIISKILTSDVVEEVETLCSYNDTYFSVFKPQIQFIHSHKLKHGNVPDVFTFQAEFPETTLVKVSEKLDYLIQELNKNKQHIILLETFNKLKDLGSGDVTDAWTYLSNQCDIVSKLDNTQPLDLVKDAHRRSAQIVEFNKQRRIPTGFDEIDKLMYGGLSTVEELLLIVARTNTGKSWVATKMMESAQKHGFPSLYYSPEMQGAFLSTRFDTWRGKFLNSKLHQGNYDEAYFDYLDKLSQEETSAFIIEDKDVPGGEVNVPALKNMVQKHGIKLLIIDGLSYMADVHKASVDHIRYKNLCNDLFRLSKECGCAVVVVLQANRETKDNKDDKGEVFPNIYNIEGSDHPARIATQVFAMRQVFEKHVLDIRLEKARTAANSKPEFSYSWDINTGSMQYLPGNQSDMITAAITPSANIIRPGGFTPSDAPPVIASATDDIVLEDEDDIEF